MCGLNCRISQKHEESHLSRRRWCLQAPVVSCQLEIITGIIYSPMHVQADLVGIHAKTQGQLPKQAVVVC